MDRCLTCWWYHPTLWQGQEYACQFYIAQPEMCTICSHLPPLDLCRQCEHARFSRADRPFCQKRKPVTEDDHCSGFEARRPTAALPCPTCREPLSVDAGTAACPQGHRWKLRHSRSICPRCGLPYGTFGLANATWPECYRDVYRICPECGWHEVEKRVYVGPALGRGYRGQHFSPGTGRVLVRAK